MPEIIFICILGALTYTDFKERRIPNVLLLAAIVVKFIFFLLEEGLYILGLFALLGNGFAVSLPVWLLAMLMDKFLHKRTMGSGDIKLIFVTGLYLGWEKNLIMLLLAGIVALAYCVIRKKKEIPFGPAIAISTACIIFLRNFI